MISRVIAIGFLLRYKDRKYLWSYFLALPQKVTKRSSPRKFDYPLTNDAKISKLAALRQLKFLRLLIVVGPSLHFLRDREDFEIAIAYFKEAKFSFITNHS